MIGILAVGLGNIGSVKSAIYNLGFDVKLVVDRKDFEGITHLVLPGVGAYSSAMLDLYHKDLIEPIKAHASAGKPLLGICLGMQLLSSTGQEGGGAKGLDLIPGSVDRISYKQNDVSFIRPHPVFDGIPVGVDFYFVHSFHFTTKATKTILGTVNYGQDLTAIVQSDNIIGTQFHPEKSQKNGLRILENFCLWDGKC